MARCLVTGAEGFVGGYLLRELLSAGHDVVATTQRGPGHQELPSDCDVKQLELLDPRSAIEVFREVQPERIFHLGALTFVPAVERDRSLAFAVNVGGTLNLLEALRCAAPEARFLLVSSAHVYARCGHPIREVDTALPPSFYGLTKRAAEQVAEYYQREGRAVFVARAFNHIGPGQSEQFVTSSFAHQVVAAERGECEPVLEVGNLDAHRDFTDVRDVVRAYRLLLDSPGEPGVFNVASGTSISIRAVLDLLLELATVDIEIRIASERMRAGEQSIIVGDASQLRSATGWSPTIPLRQSLQDILDSIRGA